MKDRENSLGQAGNKGKRVENLQPQVAKQVMGVIGEGSEQVVVLRDAEGTWLAERSDQYISSREQRLRRLSTQGLGDSIEVYKIKPGECKFVNNEGGRNVDFIEDQVPEYPGKNKFMVMDILKALGEATPFTFQTDRVQDSGYVAKIKCIDGTTHLMVITATERNSELPISAASNFRALALDLAKTICESDLQTDRPVGYDSVLREHANSFDYGPDPKTVWQAFVMLFGLRKADAKYWDALASKDDTRIEDIQMLVKTMADQAKRHPDIAAYVRDRRAEFANKVGYDLKSNTPSRLEIAMENLKARDYDDEFYSPSDRGRKEEATMRARHNLRSGQEDFDVQQYLEDIQQRDRLVQKGSTQGRLRLPKFESEIQNLAQRGDRNFAQTLVEVTRLYKQEKGVELTIHDAALILKYMKNGSTI